MTVEIDADWTPGPVRGLPVPVTSVDVTPIQGPCWLAGWSLRDALGEIPLNAEGTVTSPAALGTIATTTSLPPGTYLVNWTVSLAGTIAAADANNMRLVGPGGNIATALFPAVAGAYPQQQVEITTTISGAILVQAIAIGTVGAIYGAEIAIQPVITPSTVIELQDGNQVLGEIALEPNGADTESMPGDGLHVSQQVKLHIVSGAVTGVLYARFARHTGP